MLQQIADRLNELLKIDRNLVNSIVEQKFNTESYDTLLDHPTFIVNEYTNTIRFLGILNGLLRTDEIHGPISVVFDNEGEIVEFIVKKNF